MIELLTAKDVSLQLKCSARHVQRLAEKGLLDAIIINPGTKKNQYRFMQQTIDRFVSQQLVAINPYTKGVEYGSAS